MVALMEKKDVPTESRVGRKLSELTTKRVVVLVLLLILVMPLFNISFWDNLPSAEEFALASLNQVIDDPNLEPKDMDKLITEIKSYFDGRY